jgi:hypothetical protein
MENRVLSNNPRTAQQNRHLHWLFGQLNIHSADAIADIVWSFTEGRTNRTSELQFPECTELIKYLNNILKTTVPRTSRAEKIDTMCEDSEERKRLDRMRKGVIRSIFRWFELQGKVVSMEYVKATACRAAGADSFNTISPKALTRIYHEFCDKQRAIGVQRDLYAPIGSN